jgi:hypothetical protein
MVIIRFLMKLTSATISMCFPVYRNDIIEQSEDQITSPKISMNRLVSPHLYCVLSGNDSLSTSNDFMFPFLIMHNYFNPQILLK